ncbi:hypothetical protein D3C86_2117630 [compost metagenome]
MALARVLLMVLAVVLLLALVHAFVTRPQETLLFLGTLTLSSLAVAQPLAFITGVVVIAVAVLMVGRKQSKRQGKHLNPLH